MIDRREKREEYREIKDFYKRMLLRNYEYVKDSKCQWMFLYRNIRSVILHRGYTKTTMRWHVSYIGVGYGKPKWGAPYHPVFIIGLGNRYKRDFKTPRPLPSFCITELFKVAPIRSRLLKGLKRNIHWIFLLLRYRRTFTGCSSSRLMFEWRLSFCQ